MSTTDSCSIVIEHGDGHGYKQSKFLFTLVLAAGFPFVYTLACKQQDRMECRVSTGSVLGVFTILERNGDVKKPFEV